MHITDGVLPPAVCAGGFALAGLGVKVSLRRFTEPRVVELGVLTGLFFTLSLVRMPFGVTSVHLMLTGLLGIVLGRLSVIALLLGLTFQAILFQHGGLTTIGVNTTIAAAGSLTSAAIYSSLRRLPRRRLAGPVAALAACAGGFLASASLFIATMVLAGGGAFTRVAEFALLLHLPAAGIEALLTAHAVGFLAKVKPEMLPAGIEGRVG